MGQIPGVLSRRLQHALSSTTAPACSNRKEYKHAAPAVHTGHTAWPVCTDAFPCGVQAGDGGAGGLCVPARRLPRYWSCGQPHRSRQGPFPRHVRHHFVTSHAVDPLVLLHVSAWREAAQLFICCRIPKPHLDMRRRKRQRQRPW